MPPVDLKSLVQEIVDRITVAADRIEIRLSRAKVAAALEAEGVSQRPDLDPVVLSTEAKLRRAGKGKRLVIENGAEAEAASPKSPSKSSRNAPHPTNSKTASRDPAAVRAPHPDIWRLWLPPMRSPGS